MPRDDGAPASQAEFDIELGSHAQADFAVLSFEATEELSRPFSLEVTLVASAEADIDAAALIGEKAVLTIRRGDETIRFFSGIVSGVGSWQEGDGDARRRLRVTVVPALWKLGHRRRSRIFQDLSVPEIVKSVLDDGGVAQRWATNADYEPREYCVQYAESDLDFAARLLEEVGIFYFFEHAQEGHTVVLGDDPSVFEPLPGDPRLLFREPTGMAPETPHVETFVALAEIRPELVTLRDFNYLKPALDLTVQAGTGSDALELYEYPAGYGASGDGEKLAKIRLEELRVGAATAEGSGLARGFMPGCLFELDEHPIADLNAKYRLISVSHRGSQAGLVTRSVSPDERYRNQFTCMLESLPFRPERRTARPSIAGPQTALVVGPGGEEIYCDSSGRVKVQFHWDREGQSDDKSSCWMRVSQAWAGSGWGALYLPRIGHEVVVEFLEGDPDRPLVTGAVYNGVNPPPLSLPGDKTKSTLRSASSPGGDGSNELRFEDAQGAEEIFLHAQRDFVVAIENDKSQTVGGNEKLTVKSDRSRQVGGSQTFNVDGDDSLGVGGGQSVSVSGDRRTSVGGDHRETVGGSQTISIKGALALSVAGAAAESVALAKAVTVGGLYGVTVGAAMSEIIGATRSEDVSGDKTETVAGSKSEKIGGASSITVGGDLSESVGGDRKLEIGGDLAVDVGGKLEQVVKGNYTLKAKGLTIQAEDKLVLKVGSAKIELEKSGDVTINGEKVELKASGEMLIKGSTIAEN